MQVLVHKFRSASHVGGRERKGRWVNFNWFHCVTHTKIHWKFRFFSVTTGREGVGARWGKEVEKGLWTSPNKFFFWPRKISVPLLSTLSSRSGTSACDLCAHTTMNIIKNMKRFEHNSNEMSSFYNVGSQEKSNSQSRTKQCGRECLFFPRA